MSFLGVSTPQKVPFWDSTFLSHSQIEKSKIGGCGFWAVANASADRLAAVDLPSKGKDSATALLGSALKTPSGVLLGFSWGEKPDNPHKQGGAVTLLFVFCLEGSVFVVSTDPKGGGAIFGGAVFVLVVVT